MKTNEFFDAMGKIDPAFIERAERKVVKKSPIIKIAAIAACFALLAAGVVAVLPMLIGGDAGFVQDSIAWNDIIKMFSPESRDESTVGEINAENEMFIAKRRFGEILSGNFTDYKIGSVIPVDRNGSYIGEKLGEVEIRTGLYIYAEEKEKDVMVVKAEVYEIGGTSSNAAVAIKYLEESTAYHLNTYYIAVNEDYEPTTLSKFFANRNADAYMTIFQYANFWEVTDTADGGVKVDRYQLKEGAGEEIRDLILSLDGDGEIIGDNGRVSLPNRKKGLMIKLCFSVNSNCRLIVLDYGKIAILNLSGGENAAIFNVGTEATDALFAAFEDNFCLVADKYTDDDLAEAATGEVNE